MSKTLGAQARPRGGLIKERVLEGQGLPALQAALGEDVAVLGDVVLHDLIQNVGGVLVQCVACVVIGVPQRGRR